MSSTRFRWLTRTGQSLLLAGALPAAAAAQEAPQPVVYATYYQCTPTEAAAMDSLVRTFWGPLADRHVSAGHATTWGWLRHHTGGTWNRAFYFVARDAGNAVDAVEGLNRDGAANPRAMRASLAACPIHEDYLWQRHSGSQPAEQLAVNRPAAGFSIYYECSQGREEVADAILTVVFAPVLNRAVERGDLNSWAWLQHVIGGKYRRALVTDGRDAKTLIAAIGRISSELSTERAVAFREFAGACPGHQDFVWTIVGK